MDVTQENLCFSNHKPFVLIGGMNVLESESMAFEVCEHFVQVTKKLNIDYVFKASFDKANRSSVESFRGPGLSQGLSILSALKKEFNVPVITDVHCVEQVEPVAQVCDIIQIPAFLARQTDLIEAVAMQKNCLIHVKKPQFSSPGQMQHLVAKINHFGHHQVLLCERGTCFGYDNLVVDMLGFSEMKRTCQDIPLIFDVTHALQCRQPMGSTSNGRRQDVLTLAKAGIATGIAGLFLEAHPNPEEARCDGPCALPLTQLAPFLAQIKALDTFVKSLPALEIH